MNLNSLLCDRFDKEHKGYVTVNDVLLAMANTMLLIASGMLYLYGGCSIWGRIREDSITFAEPSLEMVAQVTFLVISAFGGIALMILLCEVMVRLCRKIGRTKIVKCRIDQK